MEWINLSVSKLALADYRRSTMQDRGVWLTLLSYCVQQENGGRIAGAQAWTEWDCQQVLGIAVKDLEGPHHLWRYEAGDILVSEYPAAKQREVEAKRRAGRKGNRIRWDDAKNTESHTESQSDSHSESGKEGEREGKGNENQNGKKRASAGGFAAPTAEAWLAYAREYEPSWSIEDANSAFDHYVGCGWRMGEGRGKPVVDWKACLRTCVKRWREKKRGGEGARAPLSGPNAHTGGLTVFNDEPPAEAAQ